MRIKTLSHIRGTITGLLILVMSGLIQVALACGQEEKKQAGKGLNRQEQNAVKRNAAFVAEWYNVFIGQLPDCAMLPYRIPDAGTGAIFTRKELENRLPSLNEMLQNELRRYLNRLDTESQRKRREEERLQSPTMFSSSPISDPFLKSFIGQQLKAMGRRPESKVVFRNGAELLSPEATNRMEKPEKRAGQDAEEVLRRQFERESGSAKINSWYADSESNDIFQQGAEATKERRREFGIPDTVDGLVYYRWYRADYLPASLEKFLQQQFDTLMQYTKSSLAQENFRKLYGWKLGFNKSYNEKRPLWLYCSLPDTTIWMSPILIRGLLIQVVRDYAPHFVLEQLGLRPANSSDGMDEETARRVILIFRQSILFLLAHELAHIYLGREGNSGFMFCTKEPDCDQYAADLLVSSGESLSLNAFKSLLAQAVEEGSGELWGLEDQNDLQAVRQRYENVNMRIKGAEK